MEESFKEKVKGVMREFFKVSKEQVSLEEIEGGFTGAAKFRVRAGDGDVFIKVVMSEEKEVDAFLIEKEGEVYEFLKKKGLTGDLFPEYLGVVKNAGVTALVVSYLKGASWGGPFNEENVKQLDLGLKRLHETVLSEEEKAEIKKLSGEIRERLGIKSDGEGKSEEKKEEERKMFLSAYDEEKGGFINAKGEVYFQGEKEFARRIIEEAEKEVPHRSDQLIMHDLNFANIAFLEGGVYLVDPVFLTLGSEHFDRIVVGVNILQQLKGETNSEVRALVRERFITNSTGLARLIKYYVVSTHKKVDEGGEKWQKFHQECAVEALAMFEEMVRPI